ncbi:MAG: UvrB/UvrC motif-containing protein [Firmicutes bacterium]|nr:UvrB/UvrC motif-containing protein [Bacillota bacterium]MCL2255894.1 UvrB/UvrC motif-containing protein [Bacillota bacterium]
MQVKCDNCKVNYANYHTIKKVNGQTTQKHLCGACHEKMSSGLFGDVSSIFSGFKNFLGTPSRNIREVCSKCGTTGEEFLEMGSLGCPKCYQDMQDLVLPIIHQVQGSLEHVEDEFVSKGVLETDDFPQLTELQKLKRELERAIKEENYEEAAVIRDKIRNID